jgi:TolB protein
VRFAALIALAATPFLLAAPVPKAGPPRLLVVSSAKDGNWEIYLVQPGTGETKNLTENKAADTEPVWSPDGARIAFISDRAGFRDVWTMKADGTDARQLTEKLGSCSTLRWSPDGSKIAFVSAKSGQEQIYVAEVATGRMVQLTDFNVPSRQPAWSPDGKRLTYSHYAGQYSTYSMNPDGTNKRQVTDANGGLDAAWAPDGKRLAYTAYLHQQKPGFRLFTVGGDGKNVKQLTTNANGFGNVYPQWSPDGSKIAFGELVDGVVQVAVVSADGGEAQVITKSAGEMWAHEYARWSPDGKSLSYVRTYRGPGKKDVPPALFVSDADGANAKDLITHAAGTGEWKPK